MASPQDRRPPAVRGSARSPAPDAPGAAPGPAPEKKQSKKGRSSSSPQGPHSLQEAKKRGQRLRRTPEREICEKLEGLDLGGGSLAEGTGLVYDERMAEPRCLWDDGFPEAPARLLAVRDKLAEYGLRDRCVPVPAREASEDEIRLMHSPQFVELMKSTQNLSEEELRALSERYDSVYLHPASYSASCLAVGSVLQLVDKVLRGEIRNGLSVVRPPGHHAHRDQMNGYCMFNQLAVAARYAQHSHGIKRVLIVDWDVHHGQGTQFLFEEDPSVLYFSVHRYENGSFWPHLSESSCGAVGKERGVRYNINVPWNKTAMTDADYVTAFLHLLLPVAYEFQPQLVLVAAGFDSVVGDPKGEMSASPSCFSHLTHLLMSLAHGRLVLSLEGGYNLRSLAEGACASLKILLGDACPRLPSPFTPCKSALDSITDTILAHRKYWRILQDLDAGGDVPSEQETEEDSRVSDEAAVNAILDASMREVMRPLPEQRTGLVYDERMMEHYNMWDSHHPEVPQRISRIFQRLKETGLETRCSRLSSRSASQAELQMCHSLSHIQRIEGSARMKPRDLHRLGSEYNSIYINTKSYGSACLAAGSVFSAVDAVLSGKVQNAVCIVRPPGHHAEPDSACGFCFFNTVALAARYAQASADVSEAPLRVMILDWDVHHGNGTQHIFQEDSSVLYVSLHRYDDGLFFPCSEDASHDRVGCGRGEGFNVNIPWNGGKMGDAEYLMAFHRVVMPVAYEFDPHLVLVSAGFDAARGDPLGGCQVTPEGYAHMTHLLMGLAGGRVVMVLEGGYNLTSISESMVLCTRTLLGDPPPPLLDLRPPRLPALHAIHNVLGVHRRYWRSLRLNVTGPVSDESKGSLPSPRKINHGKDESAQETGPPPQTTSSSSGPFSPDPESSSREKVLEVDPRQGDAVSVRLAVQEPDGQEQNCVCSLAAVTPAVQSSFLNAENTDAFIQSNSPGQHGLQKLLPKEEESCAPQTSLDTGDTSMVSTPSDLMTDEKILEAPATQRLLSEGEMERQPQGLLGGHHLQNDLGKAGAPLQGEGDSLILPLLKLGDLRLEDDGAGAGQSPDTLAEVELLEAAGGCDNLTCELFLNPLLDESGPGFTVPLSWCPHLATVSQLPVGGLDITEPCAVCSSVRENWVCLTCYQVLCGRYVSQHMLSHGAASGHSLVLSFSDLSVWCYGCEAYVHHQVLLPAKSSAYFAKFGEEMLAV